LAGWELHPDAQRGRDQRQAGQQVGPPGGEDDAGLGPPAAGDQKDAAARVVLVSEVDKVPDVAQHGLVVPGVAATQLRVQARATSVRRIDGEAPLRQPARRGREPEAVASDPVQVHRRVTIRLTAPVAVAERRTISRPAGADRTTQLEGNCAGRTA
jgi:hypothetical protein